MRKENAGEKKDQKFSKKKKAHINNKLEKNTRKE